MILEWKIYNRSGTETLPRYVINVNIVFSLLRFICFSGSIL